MVETWALGELRKVIAATAPEVRVWFWKAHGGREVDFLLERGEHLVPVEVKWSQRLTDSDTAGLRQCANDLQGRVKLGVLVYPGTELIALDRRTVAVPASILFGVDRPA